MAKKPVDVELQQLAEEALTSTEVGPNPGFHPEQVILTKGSLDTPARRAFADKVCSAFPQAEVREQLDRNHMAADFAPRGARLAQKLAQGKRTLVLGVLGNCVRRSEESNIHCPNYWHFSVTGFCWYDCTYCYLAGSCSSLVAPTVKVYVNLEDVLRKLQRLGRRIARDDAKPTSCYLGKLQDGLSLDWLTGYSRALVCFFAREQYLRWVVLTKSASVGNLLGLPHNGHTVVSWSVNPASICREFERLAPSLSQRLDAARQCVEAGYPVRFLIMPLIPIDDWREQYAALVAQIFDAAPPSRITIGGICSYPTAARLTATRGTNCIQRTCATSGHCADGRRRYPVELRAEMYEFLIAQIKHHDPTVDIGLCLEERRVWRQVGLDDHRTRCNCIWDEATD